MKRHPALIPLSRDHHNGLVQASRLRRAAADGDAAARLATASDFVEFFRNEERVHSFTRLAGRHRVALAHLLPSGAVDPAWQAAIGSASGRPVAVHALARAGSRLFVAGPFGRVGGLQRAGLAAVDTRSGAVLRSWAPQPATWLDIGALLVTSRRLLVARQSTYPTRGITALETATGTVDHRWNAHVRLIGDAGSFNMLLLYSSRV
jgi:hypothetical protein